MDSTHEKLKYTKRTELFGVLQFEATKTIFERVEDDFNFNLDLAAAKEQSIVAPE